MDIIIYYWLGQFWDWGEIFFFNKDLDEAKKFIMTHPSCYKQSNLVTEIGLEPRIKFPDQQSWH